jgi:cob(I)alamin adenosyltransferase
VTGPGKKRRAKPQGSEPLPAPTPEGGSRLGLGLLHVLTGEGRGKTTSAFGLACRAWGRGARVGLVQFVKPPGRTGEEEAARALGERFRFVALGAGLVRGEPSERDREAARAALDEAARLASSGEVDFLVLDEALVALSLGLVAREDIESLIDACVGRIELVLTGRAAPRWLEGRADYLTEMRALRHPHDRGVAARRGVES